MSNRERTTSEKIANVWDYFTAGVMFVILAAPVIAAVVIVYVLVTGRY